MTAGCKTKRWNGLEILAELEKIHNTDQQTAWYICENGVIVKHTRNLLREKLNNFALFSRTHFVQCLACNTLLNGISG